MASKKSTVMSSVGDAITPVANPTREYARREKAAEFLASQDDTSFTPEEEKKVLKRIDMRILPLLLGAYFFQQLDKSTLSYTSVFGLADDAHLVGNEYSWLGSVLYLAQLVMQPVAAFLLVKFPNGKVISAAILLWGSSLAIMSALVGSLFTYGLAHIHSDRLFRYQVIFLFCGLLTVAYSFIVFWLIPDSPMEAKFLSDREKVIATERLRANQMGIAARTWRWDHVWETATDVKTYLWFVAITSISIASGGITTFGSLIVKSFGYDSFTTILFNIPFGAIQIISIIGSAWLAKRTQRKGLVITAISVPPVIGSILMLTVPRRLKGVLLFGYYLVSCMAAITPILYNWQASNTAGDTKKKCTSAVVFIGMCLGNVIGPLLYSQDQAPLYRQGVIADLCMFVVVGAVSALIPFYLMFLNKRHARRREELGKSAALIDESMVTKKKMAESKAVEIEDAQVPQHRALEDDNALHDVTDLNNEDFIYVC
ncbi:unnamed protein product [Discula destructiva]